MPDTYDDREDRAATTLARKGFTVTRKYGDRGEPIYPVSAAHRPLFILESLTALETLAKTAEAHPRQLVRG